MGYRDITMFPHARFSKDLNLNGLKFDGIAIDDFLIAFFQVKSNCKPTKDTQARMKEFHEKYRCMALWFDCIDGGEVDVYGRD